MFRFRNVIMSLASVVLVVMFFSYPVIAEEKAKDENLAKVEVKDSDVFATVNGTSYTFEDLKILKDLYGIQGDDMARKTFDLIQKIIKDKLISDYAKKQGFEDNVKMKSKIMSVINKLWYNYYWNEVIKDKVTITDEELINSVLPQGDRVRIQQMVVREQALAAELRNKVVYEDADLNELIKEHSKGNTAYKYGDIGYVDFNTQSMYTPEQIALFFSLKEGGISPVFESEIGYSFVKILDYMNGDEYRKILAEGNRKELLKKKNLIAWEEEIERLLQKHNIEYRTEVIDNYINKSGGEEGIDEMFLEPVLIIDDNYAFVLESILDPSQLGVFHGDSVLDTIINSRAEEYVIAEEARKIAPEGCTVFVKEELTGNDVIAREYINFIGKDVNISESELKEYYQKNKDNFSVPEKIHLAVIETRSESRVKEIYKALASGESFEEVAKTWSDHKSKLRGGDIGLLNINDHINESFKPVLNLKAGEYLSTPIKLTGNVKDKEIILYAIFKAKEILPGCFTPFEKVKGTIEKRLTARKREEMIKSLMDKIDKESDVKTNDSLINAFLGSM